MSSQTTGTQCDIQGVARNKKRTRRGCADFSWWSKDAYFGTLPLFLSNILRDSVLGCAILWVLFSKRGE